MSQRLPDATLCMAMLVAALLFLLPAGCDGSDSGLYVRLTSPVGGERWAVGTVQTISWESNVPCEWFEYPWVLIDLSLDGGNTWDLVGDTASEPQGDHEWLVDLGVCPLPQYHCVLRVSYVSYMGDHTVADVSGEFRVLPVVWYVDDDAPSGGDGTSWVTAFQHPQDAVDAASAGDDVWVAAGIYTGGWVVLTMKDGVAVYGGFSGNEAIADERNATANETTLDGLDEDRVVIAASNAVLDGLTVTRGSSIVDGGGVYGEYVDDFLLANCVVRDNYAQCWGGGYFRDSEVCIDRVSFEGNEGGGGLSCANYTTAVVLDCQFIGNKSSSAGGGIDVSDGHAVVSECVFTANEAATFGGGVACSTYPGYEAILDNCVFQGNTAARGAGAACWADASLELTNCTFSGNRATEMGTVDVFGDASISVSDCIVWGNTSVGAHVGTYEDAVVTARYSCVEGGWAGQGNIDADPKFTVPGHWDDAGTPGDTSDDLWVDGDYRLSASSPCIDAGDPTSTVTEDIDGNPRSDGRVDMGAYEFVDDGPAGLAAGAGCAAGVGGSRALPACMLVAGLVCLATRRRSGDVGADPCCDSISPAARRRPRGHSR